MTQIQTKRVYELKVNDVFILDRTPRVVTSITRTLINYCIQDRETHRHLYDHFGRYNMMRVEVIGSVATDRKLGIAAPKKKIFSKIYHVPNKSRKTYDSGEGGQH